MTVETKNADDLIFQDSDGRRYAVHRLMPLSAFLESERLWAELDAIDKLPPGLERRERFDRVRIQTIKLLIPSLKMRRILELGPDGRSFILGWWVAHRQGLDVPREQVHLANVV